MFSGHYDDWTQCRMKALEKYIKPDFFKSKTMLELGSGHGHVSKLFQGLGVKITCSDAREEHLKVINERYPDIETFKIDCDKDPIPRNFDVILHWGVLYHLSEIENHLKSLSSKCDFLLLETEVCDSDNDSFYLKTQENGYDQAYNYTGIRPSPSYIEKILELNGFKFKRIEDSILNSGIHCYDWKIKNTQSWRHGLRKYWICWKNEDSPMIKDI